MRKLIAGPWWAVHVFNAIGSSVLLAFGLWVGNRWLVAGFAAFWGAANHNGAFAWWNRREGTRMGIDWTEVDRDRA